MAADDHLMSTINLVTAPELTTYIRHQRSLSGTDKVFQRLFKVIGAYLEDLPNYDELIDILHTWEA